MLIGVKYCGGCRAGFDRKAEAERTVARVKGIGAPAPGVSFVCAAPGGDYDVLLAVCGCGSLCADVSPYHAGGVVYISEAGDAVKAAEEIASLTKY